MYTTCSVRSMSRSKGSNCCGDPWSKTLTNHRAGKPCVLRSRQVKREGSMQVGAVDAPPRRPRHFIRCRHQIQRVTATANGERVDTILNLNREQSGRLVDFVRAIEFIPVDGDEGSVRLDDQTIRDVFNDPDAVIGVYNNAPQRFRQLIEDDPSAPDVVALAHRRTVVHTSVPC